MNIFNKIFLIFTVSCLAAHSQNINNIFPDFDKTGMKSSILYNPAGVSNIINLKNKKHSIGDFYQTYKSISLSDFQGRLSKLDEIKIMSENENLSDKVPIGLIFTEFDVFKENVQTEGLIVSQSNFTLRRIGDQVNIFDNHRLLVGAPLKYIQRGSDVNFLLSSETLINTTEIIKIFLTNKMKFKNPKVLYGGSVNPKNITLLRKVTNLDGFLIGGSSQNSNKFIDIIKKTFN